MSQLPLAYQRHNHQECIDAALATARDLCHERGARLTRLREQVLKLIWQSHQPLGAYTIMSRLADVNERPVAPPTVYRALEFLTDQALIHKLHSLNAFVGCCSPSESHQSHFFICRHCQVTTECASQPLRAALSESAAAAGFAMEAQSLEIMGLCPGCREIRP